MSFRRHNLSCIAPILASVLLLLSACASSPPPAPEPQPDVAAATPDIATPQSEVDALLERAERQNNPDQVARYLVLAATALTEQDSPREALAILDAIATDELPPVRLAAVRLLQSQLQMDLGNAAVSLALLQPQQFPPLEELDAAAHARFYRQRATAMQALDNPLGSALERIQLDALLEPQEQAENHDAIWSNLKQLTLAQLRSLSSATANDEVRGWYELALASRAISTDLDQQALGLQRWQSIWVSHPAARLLPTELRMSLQAQLPDRIALLLPVGTGAGVVIRDAFLGAYYSVQETGSKVPTVRIYDTSDVIDIMPLHAQARRDGAQLIIGPLLKQHVSQLLGAADLGVTTLALNNVEGTAPVSDLLYQFALSPEDEARQLARRAWDDGHRFAAVLSPRDDAANDFYTRKRLAFLEEWTRLGGSVAARDNYNDDYTTTITKMLDLDASAERRRHLQDVIRRTVTTSQRRRQDIDFIYLIAQPAPARQIVPSLAYLFAGDIPVYASQDLYTGVARPIEDRDLNGVLFPESPWLLNNNLSGVGRIHQLFPTTNAQNLRLQAFGIDAFRLASRLPLLAASSEFSVPGSSGVLHLGPQHNVLRDLSWVTIADGLVQPAP